MNLRRSSTFWVLLALAVLTVAVFAPVRGHAFLSIDDDLYVAANRHVMGGLTLPAVAWAFTAGYAANWHPLTWLSHMLDVQLFGLAPGPHHVVNLVLHILNTLLVFLLLFRMTGRQWPSAFVAALFAVHPLHVESVAWIAERKDVLSTFFWMLTLWAYVSYARLEPGRRRMTAYLLALMLFALGLMAKPMLVTLPFVMLLLDVWPLGRLAPRPAKSESPTVRKSETPGTRTLGRPVEASAGLARRWWPLVREKLPLVALAAVSSVVTVIAQQRGGAISNLEAMPLGLRVGNAIASSIQYLRSMIWPAGLTVLYPMPDAIPAWQVAGALVVLAGISAVAVKLAARTPYLIVGWLWYLGTLVPVSGLVQVGLQARADRYTYVPLLGIFIMIAWGVPDLLARWPARRVVLPVIACAVLATAAIAAHAQVGYWAGSEALWQHVLAVDPDNYFAHNALGALAFDAGRTDEAMAHYTAAVRVAPDYPEVHNNLGLVYARQGRSEAAIAEYRQALQLNPALAEVHDNLGVTLATSGRGVEATAEYEEAIRLKPDAALFHDNLGRALAEQGRVQDAIAQFELALILQPDLASAHSNLGKALAGQGRLDEAITQYEEALRLNPSLVGTHNNLGVALAAKGRTRDAITQYREELGVKPDQPEVHSNLGAALAGVGEREEAVAQCSEATRLAPGVAALQFNLGFVLARQGRMAEAVGPLTEALHLRPDLAPAHTSLAFALTSLGRLNDALPHFEEAVRLQPGSGAAHQYFGTALAGAGRFDEAIAHLQEALRLDPTNAVTRRALEMAQRRAQKPRQP